MIFLVPQNDHHEINRFIGNLHFRLIIHDCITKKKKVERGWFDLWFICQSKKTKVEKKSKENDSS